MSFSGYDESHSILCTLNGENDCIISFSIMPGPQGNTVFNLKLSGESWHLIHHLRLLYYCNTYITSNMFITQADV